MCSSTLGRRGIRAFGLGLAVLLLLLLPAVALAAPTLIDDAEFTYYPAVAAWTVYTDAGMSGGSNHYSGVEGAYAEVTFTGTTVTFISTTGNNRGDAAIYLDGVYQATVSEYSGPIAYRQRLWTKSGLTAGTHTLRVVRPGTGGGLPTNYLEIDAIEVDTVAVVSTPASSWWSLSLLALAAAGFASVAKRRLAA